MSELILLAGLIGVLFLIPALIHTVKEFYDIDIIDNFIPTEIKRIPITTEDVKWFIKQVKRTHPNTLRGIKIIQLCERHPWMHKQVFGCYYFEHKIKGGVIKLFPFDFDEERHVYTFDYSADGNIKYAFSHEFAKEQLLFTLGHEIGHHVEYKLSGMLHGLEIEMFCDEFSEGLGIAKDPFKNREHKLLYYNESMDRLIFEDGIVPIGIDGEFIYKGSSQI